MAGHESQTLAAPPGDIAEYLLVLRATGPLKGEHIFGDWLRNLGFTGEVAGPTPSLPHRREFRQTSRPPCHVQIRIGAASIPTLRRGEQLAESRFEPRTVTIIGAGQSISFHFYRASFRLLTVVFDTLGYVAETDLVDINPGEHLKRALLSCRSTSSSASFDAVDRPSRISQPQNRTNMG